MKCSALASFSTLALISAFPTYSVAATIQVDGTTYKTLSAAVSAAQKTDDGPHVINITTDKLPSPDGEVLITEAMTINGDADGNGVKCDLLADVASIQKLPVSAGLEYKTYIEVQAAGKVVINDLQIHPNADGSTVHEEFVDGIRLHCPPNASEVSEYVLNRVWVSGSDGLNGDAYVPLNTDEDLYNRSGIKRWSFQHPKSSRGVIHCDKTRSNSTGPNEEGRHDVTLNDCHVGLGGGPALNLVTDNGHHKVLGGIYGHCGNSAIRVSGDIVSLQGTEEKPLVAFRAPNEPGKGITKGGNAIFVSANGHVDVMEYIDASTMNNATAFSIGGKAQVDKRHRCQVTDSIANSLAKASGVSVPAMEWLKPEEAWQQAQSAGKQGMLLFFYAPNVEHAEQLSELIESNGAARNCLSKYACSRVDVMDAAGGTIAKKYGVFKVPTLLVISSDAKSFKRVSPDLADNWQKIETQLKAR